MTSPPAEPQPIPAPTLGDADRAWYARLAEATIDELEDHGAELRRAIVAAARRRTLKVRTYRIGADRIIVEALEPSSFAEAYRAFETAHLTRSVRLPTLEDVDDEAVAPRGAPLRAIDATLPLV